MRISYLILVALLLAIVYSEDEQRQVTDQEREDHRADFNNYDLNQDGLIDAGELRQTIEDINEQDILDFFEFTDLDKDGQVTFDEYLTAAINIEDISDDEQEQQATEL